MTSAAHPILTSSDEPNWRTPAWLREALDREFGIWLDAAADSGESSVQPNGLYLGPGSPSGCVDGLDNSLTWADWARAMGPAYWGEHLPGPAPVLFCNPPYSRKLKMPIEPWIKRMAIEGRSSTVIGVLPFAPQTQHWRRYVVGHEFRATEIRLFPFRVKFDPPPGYATKAQDGKTHGANVNTAIVIWKPTDEYPRALPWAPLQRYWVPRELPRAEWYHDAVDDVEEAVL